MPHLTELLPLIGYTGITAIIFAESGLLIGFFLPGDSLLFTAGLLASQGVFDIRFLVTLSLVAAVLGDSVGYWFGHRLGRKIFDREDSFFFHRKNLLRAESFYQAHGGKAIILARFTPIIRTFAPILAGVGRMPYRQFLSYNIIGGMLWGVGMPLVGYFLGTAVPGIDRYILLIIAGIVVASFVPPVAHVLRDPNDRARIIAWFHSLFIIKKLP